jgi:uncharacterized protein YkwD
MNKIQSQISSFEPGGQALRKPEGTMQNTKEGLRIWYEAKNELERQSTVPELQWSEGLALAAEDHCKDIGPLGLTTHTGTDRTQPWDRITRYGQIRGFSGENIAYGR